MSRGQRGKSDPPVTLFAFQDVMTSVIGIIILIVLMLALQTSILADAAGSLEPGGEEASHMAQRVAELKRRESLANARMSAAKDSAISSDAESGLTAVTRERAYLADLFRQIEKTDRDVEVEYERLRASVIGGGDVAGVIEQVVDAQQGVDRLKGELDAARMNRRLTYISMQSFAKSPVLVEIGETAWRVAGAANSAMALTLSDSDIESRHEVLAAFLEGFPPSDHYVLLIIKPSGVLQYERIRSWLSAERYDVGVDLLPEDWTSMVQGLGDTP